MKEKQRPFFTRFLEEQESIKVKTDVKAGKRITLKYPSDDEEYPPDPNL